MKFIDDDVSVEEISSDDGASSSSSTSSKRKKGKGKMKDVQPEKRVQTPRLKRWAFTKNGVDENMTDQQIAEMYAGIVDKCDYFIVGQETGEAGNHHHQGYLCLSGHGGKEMHVVKKLLGGNPHLEAAKKGNDANIRYCKKDNNYWEAGTIPEEKGSRVDLKMAKEMILKHDTWRDVLNDDELVNVCARHLNWAQLVFNSKAPEPMENFVPRPWQQELLDILHEPKEANDRRVHWWWESTGNTGKSTLASYLVRNKSALKAANKTVDTAYMWNGSPIVLFDFSRSMEDHVNFDLIEQMCSGIVVSTKYQSSMKTYKSPHVVIFANFEPDKTKLSEDRWAIKEITN